MPSFDPNAAATADSGIFGLPNTLKDAALVYLPVPWEATTSYGGGTSAGPAAILAASRQVDLYDLEVSRPYEPGLFCLEESAEIRQWNGDAKALAAKIIAVGGDIAGDVKLSKALAAVNEFSARVNDAVHAKTRELLELGKIVGVIGGDHSVPYGAIRAIADKHPGVGILHFDAHSDTRDAYEGFTHSHASIMNNVLKNLPGVKKLVQVGIRDFCEQEIEFCRAQSDRVAIHFDAHLARRKFSGETWQRITADIVKALPNEVWISFDIDGLDPRFCPHTGTPVPGGLDFHEANFIIGEVARSGRKIVGFDLNEVSPGPNGDEWDANVGARLLYKLTAWTLASQGLCKINES